MRNPQADRELAHQYANRMVEALEKAEHETISPLGDADVAVNWSLISSGYAEAIQALATLHNRM